MPILARIQPVDFSATKSVFISAIRFATSVNCLNCPPLGDELQTSAQEQIEYMLGDDEDMSFVADDNEVKLETRIGLSKIFSLFKEVLLSISESGSTIFPSLSNLEWICNITLKMGLMTEFVMKWIDISEKMLEIIEAKKFEGITWDSKVKLLEVNLKVLDAVGYGNVIVPASQRVQLLKSWLPFIRKLRPCLDSMMKTNSEFPPYKMDEDMWETIEGSIVSLVSGLPSDDQADIFADWMNADQLRYPDLSEAFEIWCFRSKSAKRRLVGNCTNLP